MFPTLYIVSLKRNLRNLEQIHSKTSSKNLILCLYIACSTNLKFLKSSSMFIYSNSYNPKYNQQALFALARKKISQVLYYLLYTEYLKMNYSIKSRIIY